MAAVAVAAGAVILPVAATHAVTRTWNGGPTGFNQGWSDGINWSPGGVPAAGDVVVVPGIQSQIDTFVNYNYVGTPITLASLTLNHNNTIGGFAATALSISLNHLSLTASAEYVGDSSAGGSRGRGRIDHTGGTNTTPLLVLGRLGTNIGTYNLSGPSHLVTTEERIGDAGTGFVAQSGGLHEAATVTLANLAGSRGTYDLSGGSIRYSGQFTIGNAGTGAFNLSGGALATHQSEQALSVLGSATGSVGDATVRGAGSNWTTDRMFVGSTGTGTLAVTEGGEVAGALAYIGFLGTGVGTVSVSGAGSRWTSTDGLWVGGTSGTGTRGGTGTLTVDAGGTMQSGSGTIAGSFDSIGTVTVGGDGARWTITRGLAVGPLGNATLNVDPGGTVSVGEVLYAGGVVRLRGGTLDVHTYRPLEGGAGSTFDWTSGTLVFDSFEGGLVNASGTLAPRHAPGLVSTVYGG